MAASQQVVVRAPAKLNLGLEILGRRDDGFHEIRTVLAMLTFGDDLRVSAGAKSRVLGVPNVDERDNLITRAIHAFAAAAGAPGVEVSVAKRIPPAAGLGGASADAAATLIAINALAGSPLDSGQLEAIAATLGSDVPFFLGSPLALASGTGTELVPLRPVPFDVILVAPPTSIANKTATLYGLLTSADHSDGRRIARCAASLRGGQIPGPALLGNAFELPLYQLRPDLADLRSTLEGVPSRGVGLSGAGPAHYVLALPGQTAELELQLRSLLPSTTRVIVTRASLHGIRSESHAG